MTYDPKLTREMGLIDWKLSADELAHRVQGLNPWPGTSCAWTEGRLKLLRAKAVPGAGEPGRILSSDPKSGLVIACGENALEVLELQAPGGKPMKAKDYLRGHPVAAGVQLKEDSYE